MQNNKISICIPCYEMKGMGVHYLKKLVETTSAQSYKNIEIVISDHSQNDEIETFCKTVNVKYYRNLNDRGSSSANVNNAISLSTGDIIKIMFQDDIFINIDTLRIIEQFLSQSNYKWGGIAFGHIDQHGTDINRNQTAQFDANSMLVGRNIFGCPSVLFFKKSVIEKFDQQLIWLMDCEYYYRLWKTNGNPLLINYLGVGVRIWESSISYEISEERKNEEAQYVLRKHL